MNSTMIAAIQSFTLAARDWLETEVGEQLEGIYGWLPSGEVNPARQYPALKTLPEAAQTRKELESYIAESREAGIHSAEARRKLLRETAFTWLNRLVALHMLEERRLIRVSVSRLTESNAYLYWLADEIDPEARQLHDLGEMPVNLMGEGPRHVAYRRFLLWQCGQLAKDVSVLFAPDTLSSRLFPRPTVLRTLIEAMHEAQLVEAWQAGNEETVGWVYQSFIISEKDRVFAGFQKKEKVVPESIGAATQLFTPKWIVKTLVENSLGRLWHEMHADTKLLQGMSYYVPAKTLTHRTVKRVRDIRLLDPACGSMHFGLVAFDLFTDMYREELRNAGNSGWPLQASVTSEDEIPTSIIQHNLYGIDIDMRAVQLSALALLLRARSMNSAYIITDRNLACANIQHITGGRLDSFFKDATWKHPIQKRIVKELAEHMVDSDSLGSLLRVEVYLQDLINAERKQARNSMAVLPGFATEQFGSDEEMEVFFETIEMDVTQKLDEFVRQSRKLDKNASQFASEASKGLRFMRLVQKHYDVVATNPPYMSRRNQSAVISAFLDKHYPNSSTDLYAAFIERCLELTEKQQGIVAMITQQSFMFIDSYKKMRSNILENTVPELMLHLGPKAFQTISGEKVNTAAFVLRREPASARRTAHVGTYFRLIREKNAEAKRLAFEAALAVLKSGQPHPQVFFASMRQYDAIPDKPWAYWMPKRFQKLFSELPLMEEIAKPRQGLATAENNRFLRVWWEVGTSRIGQNHTSRDGARNSNKRWFPYMKGGAALAWYGNQLFVLNWENDGCEIFAFRPRSVVRNPSYYFRSGVTWSDIASKGFAARLSPGGFIHDVKGMTCFPSDKDRLFVLGLLNSRLAEFILGALNPTVSNQVGDIERLPVPDKRSVAIDDLVAQCVELARQNSRESEMTYDFVAPLADQSVVYSRKEKLTEMERKIDEAVSKLYGLTEEDLAAIDRELSAAKTTSSEEAEESESDDVEETEEEQQAVIPANWARSWLSYAVGIVLGRFEVGKANGLGCGAFSSTVAAELKKLAATDGILVNDAGEPQDMSARVWLALVLLLGESEAKSRVQTALSVGNPQELLRGWLNRFSGTAEVSFWKVHHQQYKKRPVYWPLQSPKRRYTVWLFHEKMTGDTLFHIRGNIVEPRLTLAVRQAEDLKEKANTDKQARRERDDLLGLIDDLREFSKRLKLITDRGYAPHIDDGVLINATPLHEVLPSWPDCAKAWKELADGKLDWAHQAMAYWPERVEKKCKSDASLGIAHGKDKK